MKNNMNIIRIYKYIKIVWIKKMCQNLYNILNMTWYKKNTNTIWIYELRDNWKSYDLFKIILGNLHIFLILPTHFSYTMKTSILFLNIIKWSKFENKETKLMTMNRNNTNLKKINVLRLNYYECYLFELSSISLFWTW